MRRLLAAAAIAAAAAFTLLPFRADARCTTLCAPGRICPQVCAVDIAVDR